MVLLSKIETGASVLDFGTWFLVLPVPNAHTISQQTTGVIFFFRMWCTHKGQEVPQQVYTLLMCKLVEILDRSFRYYRHHQHQQKYRFYRHYQHCRSIDFIQYMFPTLHATHDTRLTHGNWNLRLVEDFEMLRLTTYFGTLHLTSDFKTLRLTPAAASHMQRFEIRRKHQTLFYEFLWPCVRCAIRVWLCRHGSAFYSTIVK